MNRLESALCEARRLMGEQRPEAALVLAHARLKHRNPYLSQIDPQLRDLAALYVHLAMNDPSRSGVIDWAIYVHRATSTEQTANLLTDLAYRLGEPAARPQMPACPPPCGFPAADRIALRFAIVGLLDACTLHTLARREALAALTRWVPHHDRAPDITYAYLAEAIAASHRWGKHGDDLALLTAFAGTLPPKGQPIVMNFPFRLNPQTPTTSTVPDGQAGTPRSTGSAGGGRRAAGRADGGAQETGGRAARTGKGPA
jgi:hypothetical protein